jgi:hypothetical protein
MRDNGIAAVRLTGFWLAQPSGAANGKGPRDVQDFVRISQLPNMSCQNLIRQVSWLRVKIDEPRVRVQREALLVV